MASKYWGKIGYVPPKMKPGEIRNYRCVYALSDNGEIFYIGESHDPTDRTASHSYDAHRPWRPQCEAQKYLREKGFPFFKVQILEKLENLSTYTKPTAESLAREQYWINQMILENHPVKNKKR